MLTKKSGHSIARVLHVRVYRDDVQRLFDELNSASAVSLAHRAARRHRPARLSIVGTPTDSGVPFSDVRRHLVTRSSRPLVSQRRARLVERLFGGPKPTPHVELA